MAMIEKLKSNFEQFKTLETNIENLNTILSFYESCIPEFFYKGENGEADNIKKIYNYIKENEDDKFVIETVDINQCGHVYTEYMDGMVKFINDIKEINQLDTEKLSSYQEKFNIAKNNDSIFIESLFEGKINQKEEMVLEEAVNNVEYLIDFIPQIKSFKTTCDLLEESVMDGCSDKNNLIQYSINMLFESVNNYCYNTLATVFETYNAISDHIFNETEDKACEYKFELF